MQFALSGALPRHQALGIRPITFDSDVHVGRDGGARTSGVEILELQRSGNSHALLVLDFEGCGSHLATAIEIEQELDAKLAVKFGERAKSIVIEPECDIWMWGSDNSLAQAIGWELDVGIRDWLGENGYAFDGSNKPLRPKEAIEAVLRVNRTARSSSLYKRITSHISLANCGDPAFVRLKQSLQIWFPPD